MFPTTLPNVRDGRQVVTTAGTAVQLSATSIRCKKLTIMALIANTGYVVVGASTVIASASTRRGIPLSAGSSITLDVDDLDNVWIDSEVNGEGVSYIYQF